MPPQHPIVRDGGPRPGRAALVETMLWAAMALFAALAVHVLDTDVAPAPTASPAEVVTRPLDPLAPGPGPGPELVARS